VIVNDHRLGLVGSHLIDDMLRRLGLSRPTRAEGKDRSRPGDRQRVAVALELADLPVLANRHGKRVPVSTRDTPGHMMDSMPDGDPAADHGRTHPEYSEAEDGFGGELVDRQLGDGPSETLANRVAGRRHRE
jgi:hypothetical protein